MGRDIATQDHASNDDLFNMPCNNEFSSPTSSPSSPSSPEGSPHGKKRTFDGKEHSSKKRHRRTAAEIDRSFACEVCQKAYGSIGALNMHSKLKHPAKPRLSPCNLIMEPEINKKLENSDVCQQLWKSKKSHSGIDAAFNNSPPVPTRTLAASAPSIARPASTQFAPVSVNGGRAPQPGGVALFEPKPTVTPKSSHMAMVHLKIGTWQKSSCGDLFAKISYEERKFIWEVYNIDHHSFSKVEISFDDVIRLEYTGLPHGYACLSLETCKAPAFFDGVSSADHKATLWHPSDAFPNSQGLAVMQHTLHFMAESIVGPLDTLLRLEPRFQFILATATRERYSPATQQRAPLNVTWPAPDTPVFLNATSTATFIQPHSEVETFFYDVLQGRDSSLDNPITTLSIPQEAKSEHTRPSLAADGIANHLDEIFYFNMDGSFFTAKGPVE